MQQIPSDLLGFWKKKSEMKPLIQEITTNLVRASLFACFLLFPILLFAQDKSLRRQIVYEAIFPGETRTLHEDRFGFIWHGNNGLYRYNGKTSKEYPIALGDSTSQRIKRVFDIVEVENGDLIIAARSGLYYYERASDEVRPYASDRVPQYTGQTPGFYSFLQDKAGRLWLGSEDTLFVIDQQLSDPVKAIGVLGLSYHQGSINLRSILEVDNGLIYVATKRGLLQVNKDFNYRYFVPENYIGQEEKFILETIRQGNGDTLWIGGSNGLWIFEMQQQIFTEVGREELQGDFVMNIFKDRQQNLWIATRSKLFVRNPAGEFRVIGDGSQMELMWIREILQDRFGNIWTGGNNGIALIDVPLDQMFPCYRTDGNLTRTDNFFFRVMQDSSGGFWFRMFNSDLGYSSGLGKDFEIILQPQQNTSLEEIKDFCTDSDGNVWVITLTNGVYLFEKGRPSYSPIDLGDSMRYAMAMSIIADRQNQRLLWFSSSFGLCSFDRFTFETKWYYPKEDLPWLDLNGVRQIHQAEDGTVWGVLESNGQYILGYLDPKDGKFRVLQKRTDIYYFKRIYQFRRGPDQTMLAATDRGLVIVDVPNRALTLIDQEKGLPMKGLLSVISDKEGNIWMTSGKRLCKYNGQEFQCFRVGSAVGNFAHTSSTITQKGHLAFGGSEGLLVFDPSKSKDGIPLYPKCIYQILRSLIKQRDWKQLRNWFGKLSFPFRRKYSLLSSCLHIS